jgi:transposase
MMIQKIERVDVIPLVIHWLKQMRVHEVIDHIYNPHTNWEGLTYGQLAVIFITYVLHSLTHRLSGMEEWLSQHKTVIEHVSGWKMDAKDATDDRLGRLTEVLGEDDDKSTDFQIQMGQQIITAHKLPTDIGRYDTTSFNVYHQSDNCTFDSFF